MGSLFEYIRVKIMDMILMNMERWSETRSMRGTQKFLAGKYEGVFVTKE
jgi:hypothetical protein